MVSVPQNWFIAWDMYYSIKYINSKDLYSGIHNNKKLIRIVVYAINYKKVY